MTAPFTILIETLADTPVILVNGVRQTGKKHAIVNITADIFTAWVRQDLLSQLPKNAVIVMDNATFHKRDDTQDMIRKAGHSLLFLPPYSPDLNPIEQK